MSHNTRPAKEKKDNTGDFSKIRKIYSKNVYV